MKYLASIDGALDNPKALEALFAEAVSANDAEEFRQDVDAAFAKAPDHLLLAAWHWRLAAAVGKSAERRPINWSLALPLSALTALTLWMLSGERMVFSGAPGEKVAFLAVLITPVIALAALAYFSGTRGRGHRNAAMLGAALAMVSVYAMWWSLRDAVFQPIASTHLPLLAWASVGVLLTGAKADATNRFAFLAKSIEVTVVTGVYALAAVVFAGLTMQLFKTLGIAVPVSVQELLFVGGAGLMPIIAVASTYDSSLSPREQDFRHGLSRMVTTLPRLMLVLTLVVLVAYLVMIPANFMQPFRDRNVLITYNATLFAAIGLLVGATPVRTDELSATYQTWLRRGIVAVAALVVLVGIYALAAVAYRTMQDRLTLNRLTIIGWNTINVVLLGLLLYWQGTRGKARWIESLHETFSVACVAYLAWAGFVMLGAVWVVGR